MSAAPVHLVNARLIDPGDNFDGPGALRIADGVIEDVHKGTSPDLPVSTETIDCMGLPIAPGIIDMRVFVGEPGGQHRETFRSASEAAAAGGVTTIVAQPDTDPVLDDPALVEFVLSRARDASKVNVAVMGALTRGLAGREMTEQRLLLDAGAVALTDADHAVRDAKTMRGILTYAHGTGALVVHHVQEPSLSQGTCATSGEFASRRGLPAVPAIAERMMLERDLALIESTGARYHADQITTEGALAPLLRARDAHQPVTAATSIHHLTLNEFDIANWRSFFKLTPPLRAEMDRLAVVDAVASGLIDVIHSSHLPQDEETKRLPFEEAAPGAIGLETLLPAALRLVHDGPMDLMTLFHRLSTRPAEILDLHGGRLAKGVPADLVWFDPDRPFILDRETLKSRSKNTPFDRVTLQGKVLGTWVAGKRVHDAQKDPS
ncbi:MAG: dihydroorotase [Paracoccaceae bacterium]